MIKKYVCMMAAAAALGLMAYGARVRAEDPVAPTCQKASAPSPKDGATDARRDGTTLKWTAGGTTGKYDVYLGTVRKYVDQVERDNPVYVQASIGQKTETFNPGRLELGQTYYWRVDEVNDVDPNNVTVCRGDIWSFMVEVPALPVGSVTATASSAAGKDQGPEKAANGAGLSTAGLHSAEPNDMWLSAAPVKPAEPSAPAEPNAPVAPAEPNAPAAPAEPNAPAAPAEPNAPVAPAEPNAPAAPAEPNAPAAPAEPNAPAAPAEPNAPAAPAEPNAPVAPAEPNAPAAPAEPNAPAAPAEPNAPAAPAEPIGPEDPNATITPQDLKAVPQDPNAVPQDPNAIPQDPNAVPQDPNAVPQDPNAVPQEPDVVPQDPNAVPQEPDVVPQEPNTPPPVEVPPTWIQFRFKKVQKLYDMSIWNWNAADSLDLGVRNITVQYSTNGTDWTTLGDFELAQGTGTAEYACDNIIHFGGVLATHVKLTINSGFGTSGAYGLSEVKFSGVPVYAREASPASGAKNIALDGTLSWRAGLEAASHLVYIGTDKAAVENGTAPSFATTTNSFKLTSLDVQLDQTYYWRVDEVNEATDPTSFVGDIWSFSAVDYLVVEDFEKYKSDLGGTWPTINGSAAAIDKSIVHGGKQALAIKFDTQWAVNVGAKGTVTAPKNWTKNGVKKLVLFVHGDPGNWREPVVLRINDKEAGSLSALTNMWWGCWVIDLAPLGSTVKSVSSITIGHDSGFGIRYRGTEKLYIDDIRLYNTKAPSLPDIVTKVMSLNSSGATKGQFDTLIAAVNAADVTLLEKLSSDETYTLFAPTNAAFQAAGISAKTDKVILNDILLNQIVAKNVSATNKGKLKSLEGSTLIQDANVVTDDLGGQAVITASAEALNGAVHTTDALLMPFNMAKIVDILKAMNAEGEYAGQFDTLLAAIGAAKSTVRDTLGKRHETLFAPTDDAFAALGYDQDTIKNLDQSVLTDILLYHIASGRLMGKDLTATITTALKDASLKYSKDKLTDAVGDKAKILGYDVEGTNGVIHVIDAVAMPFAQTRLMDVVAAVAVLNGKGALAGEFDTLLAAAEAADPAVLGAIAGKGPYTILAPTDEAFAALGLDPNTVKDLDPVYLGDVLLYHALAGKLSAKDAVAAVEIETVQGGVIVRDPNDPNNLLRGAFAGAAQITTPDLEALNGLIQVVDAVLLPYEEPVPVVVPEPEPEPLVVSLVDTVAALNAAGEWAGQFDTFLAVVASADKAVVDALSGTAENTLFVPTDDAFAALDPAIDSLDKIVVTDILLYHIAAGKLLAADVSAAESIPMLKGGSLQQADGVLTDNTGTQAKITGQDLTASNGVVHVIDAVMLPAKL